MAQFDRITFDPQVMQGQPCVRGMRLTVRRVLQILATSPDREYIRVNYPELEEEDIRQALEFAASVTTDGIRIRRLPLMTTMTHDSE